MMAVVWFLVWLVGIVALVLYGEWLKRAAKR